MESERKKYSIEIQNLKDEIQQMKVELKEKQEEINKKQEEINKMQEEIIAKSSQTPVQSDQDSKLTTLEEQLAAKTKELTDFQANVRIQFNKIKDGYSKKDKIIQELKAENGKLREKLGQPSGSTSTTPSPLASPLPQ